MDNSEILTPEAFENSFNKLSKRETFKQRIEEILQQTHCNVSIFENKTGLNRNIYSNLRKQDYKPTLRVVVTICIGLGLDAFEAEELLKLSGYVLVRTRKLDYAYSLLLENSKNIDITESNNILIKLGFNQKDLLGSQEYNV